jgi:hypothetical protein
MPWTLLIVPGVCSVGDPPAKASVEADMRYARPTMFSISLMLLLAGFVTANERSVYFYGIEKLSDAQWTNELDHWRSQGIGKATVSLEAGPRFLLADRAMEKRFARLFAQAAGSGVRIEGMILQDPSWILRSSEARERTRVVLEFALRYPGTIDSVQIDVEPYTVPGLAEQTQAWKQFATLVSTLRQELDRHPGVLQLTAAVPWWLAYVMANPELRLVGDSIDEFVMMAYGDPGGEPVAADIVAFKRKVIPAIEKLNIHARSIRVGVATYEHVSASSLTQFIVRVGELLARMPSYRGTATFLG